MDQRQSDSRRIPPVGRFSKIARRQSDRIAGNCRRLGKIDEAVGRQFAKLRDFYETAMDEAKRNEQGAKPLAEEFAEIAKMKSPDDLIVLVGKFQADGLPGLFAFGVDQDEKHSSQYAVQLWQGGLGLPDRDYYLSDKEDTKRIREQYKEHIANVMQLLGDSPEKAKTEADAVLRIETQLAEVSRTPVQLRDREAQYNKMTNAELAELTPNLDWTLFWKTVNAQGVTEAIVGQPEFFKRVNEMLKSVSMADWQAYLRWHVIHSAAPYLSDPFVNENFKFYGQTLVGTKELLPRWKRAINTIDREMGEALGKLYVEKYFPPEAKKRMDEMVKNLMAAYQGRIESRDWIARKQRKKRSPN